ncbi:hypothetical protein [uncultured Methylibium sp.]|uniref:hypothetical protein n=1 Tax=uncultured Methylibium sp. TaxID=381093 RepID=UPI0025E97BED|nr:hypothetical protein [uncultured Methylibium sp.]
MESVTDLKQEGDGSNERERSTIAFPYADLDSIVEVVKGVHSAGGTACDYDQLAAELKMEAKGGGFRLRIGAAQTFGVISYERGGRISLTDLGRQLTDPQLERSARVAAFLAVPLYQRVFEQFKGGPLPPQAGLERAIESMGVGAKVKEKARQVLMRSAKQAGFFDAAADRLVKPSVRQEAPPASPPPPDPQKQKQNGNGGGGGGGGHEHPLIQGLLLTLPAPGTQWEGADRANWLTMANSIFTMIYKGAPATIAISGSDAKGGAKPDE